MKKIIQRLRSTKGEGYIDVTVLVIVVMIMLCLIMNVAPVFITKMSLNNYANELAREAEIAGRIGSETNERFERLNENSDFIPDVQWSTTGKIQIVDTFSVTVSTPVDFSFYVFGGNPVVISATAEGTSEVYWK